MENTKNKKIILWILLSISIFIFIIYIFISRPISNKDNDIFCEYKGKFNKIICTQIGDMVPKWLDLDASNLLANSFNINNPYNMYLVLQNKNGDYITMSMADKVFIPDMKRKIIYELKEQTLLDYIHFKNFVSQSQASNYGSIILFCSETNLKDNVCKNLKNKYKD